MIEVILAALGYVLAALCLGLWWGERGRRRDLAWLVGRDRREPEPVTVRSAPDAESEAIEAAASIERERLVADLMDQTGCSPEEAEAEADRIIAHVQHMGSEEPW